MLWQTITKKEVISVKARIPRKSRKLGTLKQETAELNAKWKRTIRKKVRRTKGKDKKGGSFPLFYFASLILIIPPINAHTPEIRVNTRLAEKAFPLSKIIIEDPVTSTHSLIPRPFILRGSAARTEPL